VIRYAVAFSPKAETQLSEIESYLAERFYPANAERYVLRLTRACHSIALAPHIGTRRDDLRPGLRTTGFERRVTIYFKVVGQQVLIVGIYYAGRTFEQAP
jgi:toxin ParE1/3/4